MASTSHSPFLALPAELRNRIYELVLQVDGSIMISQTLSKKVLEALAEDPDVASLCARQGDEETALLRTCKQIRQEAASIYYSGNTFKIISMAKDGYMHDTPAQCLALLESFIQRIGPANEASLSSINLVLGRPDLRYSKAKELVHIEISRSIRNWHLKNATKGLRATFLFTTYFHGPDTREVFGAAAEVGFKDFRASCRHAADVQVIQRIVDKSNMTKSKVAEHYSVGVATSFLSGLGKAVMQDVRRSGRQKGRKAKN